MGEGDKGDFYMWAEKGVPVREERISKMAACRMAWALWRQGWEKWG